MENFEIAKKIEEYKTRLTELETAIDLEKLTNSIKSDEDLMVQSDFYSDMKNAEKVLKRVKIQKENLNTFNTISNDIEELEMCFEIHKTEGDQTKEIEELIKKLTIELDAFEVKMLLSKEYDHCDAIMELHPGAGGTESQDFAAMLFRMYRRYAERHNFTFEVLDYLDGEEAGIKSVTFMVSGDMAYGYLKSEQGVHRLVRISPFDSNARRHTSFCAATVTPSIDSDINIEIKPEDIRVDTYRSSGAGGQHINKTDSAIRVTHFPTGIVVTCQNERSQIQNRERAMNVLKSKLYQLEREEQEKKIKAVGGAISENSFGSQIRSYVCHPYTMVKDHRTGFENFNFDNVMDGDIEGFINAYLKSKYNIN